jgi:hypothetical protein
LSAADLDALRVARERDRFLIRLSGKANLAGGLHDRAELCSSTDGNWILVLGVDDRPVEVPVSLTRPVELFD